MGGNPSILVDIVENEARNNDSPLYLYDCFLPFIRKENELNLRNQPEFKNPPTRLQLFANSFFPSSIKSWNNLSPQLRNAPTLNRFKQTTKNQTIKPPKFYNAGCRILDIISTRLRHRSSSWNVDLFRVYLANDPDCICGYAFEDATHFILECCHYNEARQEFILRLVFLHELKIEVLLFDDDTLIEKKIYKFSNLYNCTSNEQNVLPIYDHNTPFIFVLKSISSRCFHFTYRYD